MSRWHLTWLTWTVAMAVVIAGLGLQIQYATETSRCLLDPRLGLCSGPLPAWLMPATVVAGLLLTAVATWRLALDSR